MQCREHASKESRCLYSNSALGKQNEVGWLYVVVVVVISIIISSSSSSNFQNLSMIIKAVKCQEITKKGFYQFPIAQSDIFTILCLSNPHAKSQRILIYDQKWQRTASDS